MDAAGRVTHTWPCVNRMHASSRLGTAHGVPWAEHSGFFLAEGKYLGRHWPVGRRVRGGRAEGSYGGSWPIHDLGGDSLHRSGWRQKRGEGAAPEQGSQTPTRSQGPCQAPSFGCERETETHGVFHQRHAPRLLSTARHPGKLGLGDGAYLTGIWKQLEV